MVELEGWKRLGSTSLGGGDMGLVFDDDVYETGERQFRTRRQ